MGLSWYVSLERPVDGADPLGIPGKALAHAANALNDLAKAIQLRTLSSFISISADQIAEFEAEVGRQAPEEVRETWFQPAEGLMVVKSLVDHILASGISELQRNDRPRMALSGRPRSPQGSCTGECDRAGRGGLERLAGRRDGS
jgi:hypothetical protein